MAQMLRIMTLGVCRWGLFCLAVAWTRGEVLDLPPRERPLLLAEGWWRGVVSLASGPAEFFMEVRGTEVATARVVLHSEFHEIELGGLVQDVGRVVIPGRAPGERLEGRARDGVFFGRYHPGSGTPDKAYAFWAERSLPWEATPPVKVWNLTGTWILSLGPLQEVELVLAHQDGRLRALWREGGSTVRYFTGPIEAERFTLVAWPGGQRVVGAYEAGGYLRGECIAANGDRQPFTMRRKLPSRPAPVE